MTDTKPGADELETRERLRKLGVGPDAELPAVPPRLPDEFEHARPRDWLDDLLDTTTSPAPVEEPEEAESEPAAPETPAKAKNPKAKAKKRRRRKRAKRNNPDIPRSAWDSQPQDPRQSLLDAWAGIPYRMKWLAHHASAAYLGWTVGLVGWATYVTGWIADGHLTSPQAVFWYVAGALTVLLHHRTRGWWWPVAWLAAVPVSSTVVGVLLYGTPNP